jgi:hypothetical protein
MMGGREQAPQPGDEGERPGMEQGKRGWPLTICAIAFGLLAVSDLTKPFSQSHDPQAGLVFFGTKLTGTADLIIASLFAAFLAIYAIGIWQMKRYAMPMSYVYATYVFINLLFFVMKHHNPRDRGGMPFIAVYATVALGVSIGSAVLLTLRRQWHRPRFGNN